MTPLQKNLTYLLKQNNLSIAKAEKLAGLRLSTLRNIIRGQSKNPTLEVLKKIALFFECSVSDLTEKNMTANENEHFLELIDYQTLENFSGVIRETFEKNNMYLTFSKYYKIQKECYEYSIQNNSREIDLKFLKWIIAKEANYNEKD